MKIINSYKPLLPKEADDGSIEHIELNAILTEDAVGQYAVYVGVGSDEFVKKHGQKQTYERALNYYPFLKEEEYRR